MENNNTWTLDGGDPKRKIQPLPEPLGHHSMLSKSCLKLLKILTRPRIKQYASQIQNTLFSKSLL